MTAFCIGGLFEVVGYIGRAASAAQTSGEWTLGPYSECDGGDIPPHRANANTAISHPELTAPRGTGPVRSIHLYGAWKNRASG